MNFTEGNIKFIKEKFPELMPLLKIDTESIIDYQVLRAKNGQNTLKADNGQGSIFLHSTYNPEKEAQKMIEDKDFIDNDLVFIFGLGLGYPLQEVVRKVGDKKVHIYVIEKDTLIFKLALENNNLQNVLAYPWINFIIGLTEKEAYFNLSAKLKIELVKNIYFIDHLPSVQLNEDYYCEVLKKLRDSVSLKLSNIATIITFKGAWLKNTLYNLPTVYKSPGICNLAQKFNEVPVIIVSAGPSLDKNLKFLRQAKGKAIIIAVGTSLRSMLKENILPDLVIAYDASEKNYEHFKGIDYSDIPLVYEPMVHPKILEDHSGMKFIFNNKQTKLSEDISAIFTKGVLESGGSIANCALSLSLQMGCNPVILIGQDLAYLNGRSHTKDSIYGQDKLENMDSFHYFGVPGYNEESVFTSRSLYTFLKWFEIKIDLNKDTLFINATEGGAKIKGTLQLTLNEAIEKYCVAAVNVENILKEAYLNNKVDDLNEIIEKLTKIKDGLIKLSIDAKKAEKLCIEQVKMFSKKVYVKKKVNKIMKNIDNLEEGIKTNLAANFLTEMIQDVLLASERGELVKEDDDDDDFMLAAKRAESLRQYYEAIHKASEEECIWFQQAINDLNNLTQKGEVDRANQ